jgi:hypothetical protein
LKFAVDEAEADDDGSGTEALAVNDSTEVILKPVESGPL